MTVVDWAFLLALGSALIAWFYRRDRAQEAAHREYVQSLSIALTKEREAIAELEKGVVETAGEVHETLEWIRWKSSESVSAPARREPLHLYLDHVFAKTHSSKAAERAWYELVRGRLLDSPQISQYFDRFITAASDVSPRASKVTSGTWPYADLLPADFRGDLNLLLEMDVVTNWQPESVRKFRVLEHLRKVYRQPAHA